MPPATQMPCRAPVLRFVVSCGRLRCSFPRQRTHVDSASASARLLSGLGFIHRVVSSSLSFTHQQGFLIVSMPCFALARDAHLWSLSHLCSALCRAHRGGHDLLSQLFIALFARHLIFVRCVLLIALFLSGCGCCCGCLPLRCFPHSIVSRCTPIAAWLAMRSSTLCPFPAHVSVLPPQRRSAGGSLGFRSTSGC